MRRKNFSTACPKALKSAVIIHGWWTKKQSPMCLTVTAIDEADNSVMALRHKQYDVRGVQFHPESILTEYGKEMMANWIGA